MARLPLVASESEVWMLRMTEREVEAQIEVVGKGVAVVGTVGVALPACLSSFLSAFGGVAAVAVGLLVVALAFILGCRFLAATLA